MAAEVALVTGGAQRIGRAISLALAAAGYAVVIHCNRSRLSAEALAQTIAGLGGRATVVQGDLATAAAEDLVAQASKPWGAPTLLVNNASIFTPDRIETLEQVSFARTMQVNLLAPVLLAQAFARSLPAGREGAIVNLIDQRVLHPGPDFFSYTLAKAALHTATQTLALALAPRIRVNGVGPGPVLPNQHDGDDGFAREVAAAPLRRAVAPDEVAAAVVFLARSPGITGQMLTVDAGQHLV